MTIEEFRGAALKVPGAVEAAHMDHPDFRVNGKIFASLGYPDAGWGMVKLTPTQQRSFMKEAPEIFSPLRGRVGKSRRNECLSCCREKTDYGSGAARSGAEHR